MYVIIFLCILLGTYIILCLDFSKPGVEKKKNLSYLSRESKKLRVLWEEGKSKEYDIKETYKTTTGMIVIVLSDYKVCEFTVQSEYRDLGVLKGESRFI